MNLLFWQVKNEGGEDAHVQLTVLAVAVTYNSLHRGECQRQMINVTVPAHQGQHLTETHEDILPNNSCVTVSSCIF